MQPQGTTGISTEATEPAIAQLAALTEQGYTAHQTDVEMPADGCMICPGISSPGARRSGHLHTGHSEMLRHFSLLVLC